MIVGTGNVGASIAFALVNQRTAVNELILTDINEQDAEGEAMDLRDALPVAPSFMKIRSGSYNDASDCDIIILTAGAPQKPGEPRTELISKNATIFKDIVSQIMKTDFNGIFLVVTNPMDALTYLTWQYSGLPSEQVIGTGTVLDSARLRHRIAERLSVHPKSVHAYQIGEHGDSELTVWSAADVGGQKLTTILRDDECEAISNDIRNEVYRIIEKKGATYYGIGACVVQIINCILNDEWRVLAVSSYDDFTDTYNGFPTVLGRNGVVRRLHLDMTEQEGIAFQKSINAIKNSIKSL